MKAPLPADEPTRLQVLRDYAVLDTPSEPDFDDIVALAAQICGVSTALITLIDEQRQWFKARVGIEGTETPRELAFCAHAILRPTELLVVADATKDRRFADNPYVTEKNGIRFYAGAPLVTPGGHALGTLCVVDRVPRDLTPEQLQALATLSRHVMTQLQLRRHLAEQTRLQEELSLREREQRQLAVRLNEAQAVAKVGSWETDLATMTVSWSEQTHRIFETSAQRFQPTHAGFLDLVHPEDRAAVDAAFSASLATVEPSVIEHRLNLPDGRGKTVEERWEISRDATGTPVRAIGTCRDVTESKRTEAERQRLVRDLRERVKELRALHAAANLLRQDDLDTAEVLMRIATLLPAATLHADVAAAAVAFGADERSTAGFQPTPWMMEAGFATSDGIMGRLRIVYLQVRPREKEGPFLAEERALIDAVAEMLRTYFERRRAAAAVQHGQRMSRLAGRLASVGSWSISLPEKTLAWSVEMHEIMEVPVGEQPSLADGLEAYPPESRARVVAAVEACIVSGAAFDLEAEIDTAKGRRLWVRVIGEAVRDASGRIVQLQGAFQDITSRKAEETARQALADRLTAMLESLTDGFFTLDRNWRFSYLNSQAERLFHSDRSELVGQPIWEKFPEAKGTVSQEAYERAMRDNVAVQFETFYPPLNVWFEARAFPSPEGLAVYFRDVTETRRAHEALRSSEERFREMAENIGDIFYNYDPVNRRLLYANPAFERIWGRPLAEIYARPTSYLEDVHPEDRVAAEAAFVRQQAGEATVVEFRIIRPDGATRWIQEQAVPIRDPRGGVERIVGTMRDITAHKLAEARVSESEDRFRLLAKSTKDAIWDWNLQTDEIWWSEGFELLFGYRRDEIEPGIASWSNRLHPEERDEVVASIQRAIANREERWSGEYRFLHKDGRSLYVLDRGHIIRDATGKAVRMVGGITDLSERKEAEEATRRANEVLEGIVTALQEITTARLELQGVMELMAARAQTLTGGTGAIIEMLEGDDMVYRAAAGSAAAHAGLRLPRHGSLAGLAVQEGRSLICDEAETDTRVDREVCRRMGVRSMVVAPLRDGRDIIGVLKVLSDRPRTFGPRDLNNLQILVESLGTVIQRQRAAATLQESEAQYRLLFAGNPHPMWVFDRETLRFLAVNEAALQHYGYTLEEFLAMTVLDLRGMEDHTSREQALARMPAKGRDFGLRQHRKKDGTAIVVEALSDGLVWSGRPARLVLAQDVTERLRAEKTLREQAALLDKAQDAILVRDLEHRILYWNKSAERLYGWTPAEALGRSVRELLYFDPGIFDEAMVRLLDTGEWVGELAQKSRTEAKLVIEGRWTLVRDETGRPTSVLAINTDITERKKLEQQFLRAQRMESIGTLAGGIAHDLNNLLAPITMGVDLLKQFEPAEKSQRIIQNIERSARRGADLVKQVLSFARGVEGARVAVHLRHVVHEIESMVENTFPKNIHLEHDLPRDLWLVTGDPTQLNQVLLNLCVNARDAMPGGGQLSLTARNVTIDAQYAVMNRGVVAGRYVVLEVTDTGCGMKPEVQERIFDPFFTTKDIGKGTGLGLSTVMGIIRSHGGFVNVYSEPGRGTTFKVYLPAQDASATEAVNSADETALPRGNGEMILIVDDEISILSITKQTLETFGYRVVTAEDGAQAIGLYALNRTEVAVVLTDMMMPVMDGPALIAALRRINPQVRVIAASGLAANGEVARATGAGVRNFLAKPYSAESLLRLLRKVIAEPTD